MTATSKSMTANKIINNYTTGATVAGLIPTPLIDTIITTGVQLKMIHAIAKVYDVAFSNHLAKGIIASLAGSLVPLSLRTSLLSLSKGIPALSTIVSIAGFSALSASTTYAIGKTFVMHFESGGTLLDFNPEKMRTYFQQQQANVKKAVTVKNPYTGVKP